MAKAPRVKDPDEGKKAAMLIAGLLAAFAGTGLLLYGLAPAGALLDLFGDFRSIQADSISNMMDELGARAVWDILGAILLFAGIILCKLALRKPKPKTMEEQVNEAVEKRLAELKLQPAAPAPVPAPAPLPVPQNAPSNRCPKCGSLLVAGGRLCRRCDSA